MKKSSLLLGAVLMVSALTATVLAQTSPDTGCMQNAVHQRTQNFISAFNTYHASIITAFQAQETADTQAWSMPNGPQRTQALAASASAFATTYNRASRNLDISKRQINQQFQQSTVACKGIGGGSSSSASVPPSCIAYCPDGSPYNKCMKSPLDGCFGHNGSSASASSFLNLSSLSPSSGPVGTQVTITGTGFVPQGNTVEFASSMLAHGGYAFIGQAFTSTDGTHLTFTVPPDYPAGSYNVFVRNENRNSNAIAFVITSAQISSSSGCTPMPVHCLNGMRATCQNGQWICPNAPNPDTR